MSQLLMLMVDQKILHYLGLPQLSAIINQPLWAMTNHKLCKIVVDGLGFSIPEDADGELEPMIWEVRRVAVMC